VIGALISDSVVSLRELPLSVSSKTATIPWTRNPTTKVSHQRC
jgi:hypothetical protein